MVNGVDFIDAQGFEMSDKNTYNGLVFNIPFFNDSHDFTMMNDLSHILVNANFVKDSHDSPHNKSALFNSRILEGKV